MKSKRLALGSYAFFLCALVLAAVILINLFLHALPSSLTKLDLSDQKLFTIDEQTKKIVSELSQDVNVYLIAENQKEDPVILQLLERYKDLSAHVKVKLVDPVENPGFVSKYTDLQINLNSIIVESDKRSTVIDYTEIYAIRSEEALSYYYQTGVYAPDTFCGENELTGAINYVTTDVLPVVGVLSGHGETELSRNVIYLMESDNMDVQSVALLRTGIPENCTLILINAPASDISGDELNILRDFLAEGKKILLLTDSSVEKEKLENLSRLTEDFGLERVPGLVCEGDPGNYYLSPSYIFPSMASHSITDPLINGRYFVFLTGTHGIQTRDADGIIQTALLESSAHSYAKADPESETLSKAEGDADGPWKVGVLAENSQNGSALLWIAFPLADESVDAFSNGANLSLFLNSAEWLCGKTDTLSIRTASLESEYLTVSEGAKTAWTTVFCAVIPVGILFAGGFVWYKRRNR